MFDYEYLDELINIKAGAIIKKEREKQNLSLEQLSHKSGVSKQNIYYYEIGRNRIKVEKYIKLCSALNLDFKEVLEIISLEYIRLSK